MENENKKSKKGLSLAIVAIIIIAIIAGVAYYFLRPVSPKDLFVSQINAVMDETNAGTTSTERVNSTITLSGNIETSNEEVQQIAQILNQGKLTLNVQADTNAKKALIGANVDYQNENLINAKMFYQDGDNNVYLFVQDLFDKYFKVSTEGIEQEEEMSGIFGQVKDAKTASQIIKDTITANLKDEYFSKENVDGMTKNTMKLTVAELRTFFTNVVTSLRDNQKFLDCFEGSEKIKEGFEEVLKEINEMEADYDSARVEVSLYTKGASKDVQKADMKVVVSETEEGTFTVNKIDENNAEFNVEVKGMTSEMPFTAQALTGTIKKEKVDNNTANLTIVVNNVPEVGKVTLNMEVKKSDSSDLDSVDTTNAVDFNNMTQSEMMTFYTNLTKMKIYPYIAPYLGAQ